MSIAGERERIIYEGRFSEANNRARDEVWKVLVEEYFQPMIPPDATVLDLGCGFGEFLKHVRCARRIGVDVNSLSAHALGVLGVEYHQASIGDLSFLPDGSVDFVFSSNVIEHLPDKPAVDAALREARRVLRQTGQFVLMGPNVRYVPGEYWDYWDHVVPISDRSLAEALRIAGFSSVERIARFMPYTTKSRLPKAAWIVRLYLKVPWVWRLVGKQFLVRARP